MQKGLVLVFLILFCTLAAQAQVPVSSGGGEHDVSRLEAPMTAAQRQAIQTAIRKNIQALDATGKRTIDPTAAVSLSWPLQASDALPDFGYHGISNFVDQNASFPNEIEDYNCGARTYDRDNGYNHQGIDFFLWPFSWFKMDHDHVEIVAAAPGTIVFKQDGNFDRSCDFGGTWNAVYIEHSDGSIAWYGHMKSGSPTSKDIGATVERGEYLGVVGSSGSSTGPHLHLELQDADNNLIEPYAGTCNRFNTDSWWDTQRPYYDSAVNALTTGGEPADFPSCPTQEVPNARNAFDFGERIYFTTFYRDQLKDQASQYTIFRPDGSTFTTWTHSMDPDHFASSWWWWSFDLPATGLAGEWTFQVDYEGQTYTHTFMMNDVATAIEDAPELPEGYRLSAAYPNPFNPSTQISLELETDQHVRLAVYDLLGRPVAELNDGRLAPHKRHTFTFEAGTLPSGIYILKATGEAFDATRRLVLLK